jgi:hypothetical protein
LPLADKLRHAGALGKLAGAAFNISMTMNLVAAQAMNTIHKAIFSMNLRLA